MSGSAGVFLATDTGFADGGNWAPLSGFGEGTTTNLVGDFDGI